jgi:hypothetical protein
MLFTAVGEVADFLPPRFGADQEKRALELFLAAMPQ